MKTNIRLPKTALFTAILFCILCMCTVCGFAAEGDVKYSGNCGSNVQYTVTEKADGTYLLSLTGEGDMYDWMLPDSQAWKNYRDSISQIVIGEGITGVGVFSFYNLKNAVSVTLPSTLAKIDDYGFYGCGFTAITLPAKLKSIGFKAFESSKVQNIQIPASVEMIDGRAFANTPFGDALSGEFVMLGDSVLYKYNGTSEKVTIPGTVKHIAGSAFSSNSALKEVIIPSSVTSIGNEAFYNCSALEKVTIPETVGSIGRDAFKYTPFIEAHTEDFIILAGHILYKYQGTDVSEVTIPAGVDVLATESVLDHNEIKKLNLPSKLVTIEADALAGTCNMDYITIPASVKNIGKNAVGFTKSATYVYGRSRSSMAIVCKTGSAAATYASGNYFTAIYSDKLSGSCGENAKYKVDLDAGTLTVSGSGAIYDYSYYSNNIAPWLSASKFIKKVTVKSGITRIGNYGFYSLSNVESFTLADSIASIGNNALYGCTAVTYFKIPAGVTNLDNSGINSFSALASYRVSTGNTAFSVSGGVLYNADKSVLISYPKGKNDKTAFTVPASVKKIQSYALSNGSLEKITVQSDACTVENYAFNGGGKLKSITFKGTAPAYNNYSYYNIPSDAVVCYDSTNAGWAEYIQKSFYNFSKTRFKDMAEIAAGTVRLSVTSAKVRCGDELSLAIIGDTVDESYFTWTSSAPLVAIVDGMGKVTGVSAGKATISAVSLDGTVTLKCTVTVTGALVLADHENITLPADTITFNSISSICENFAVDGIDGQFILDKNILKFLSYYTMDVTPVLTLPVSTDAYVKDGRLYVCGTENSAAAVYVYDLKTLKGSKVVSMSGESSLSVCADGSGRIYLATSSSGKYYIHLFDNKGAELSKTETGHNIYSIGAVDDTNGNVYYEGYWNWRYWGYDHDVRTLYICNVNDNVISAPLQVKGVVSTYDEDPSMQILKSSTEGSIVFGQCYYSELRDNISLFAGKYLFCNEGLLGRISLFDSNSFVYGAEGNQVALSYTRSCYDTNNTDSSRVESVGTRTAYLQGSNTALIYMNDKVIYGIDPDQNKLKYIIETAHPVFALNVYKNYVVATEKEDGVFYIELIKWSEPTAITATVPKKTLEIAETVDITVTSDSTLSCTYEFSSSDDKTVGVTDGGKIIGVKPGKAVITITEPVSGATAKITITVKESAVTTPSVGKVVSNGTVTDNASDNNYSAYANVVKSYLYENADGSFTRVEYTGGSVLVETYDSSFKKKTSRNISAELPLFGGFFAGEDNNYLVFGQRNDEESDGKEVLRVVKYSKDWTRISSCLVKGANTYIPFDAGSCRMAETDDLLYVYTCHEMYQSSDGYHHQANMTFKIDKYSMTVMDSYYDVMNLGYGYVSHSFNQFIQSDGEKIYRVDHGDAHPRGVSFTSVDAGDNVTDVRVYGTIYGINGYEGANATGVSVGGFEISPENCLVAINSVDMYDASVYSAYGKRNIVVISGPKAGGKFSSNMLTNYTSEDSITVKTPHLVKYNDYIFVVMWEETDSATGNIYTRIALISDTGKQISDSYALKCRLSDCKPIVTEDGLITWYVTDGNEIDFYQYNPYDLTSYQLIVPESTTRSIIRTFGDSSQAIETYKEIGVPITYVSSNENIVKVTSDGVMSFVGVGSADVTISVAETDKNFAASSVIHVTVNKVNIEDVATITVNGTYVYTGSAIKPSITVKRGTKVLTENTDYVVAVSNNINAGQATVTIAGRGNYKGSASKTFTIKKADHTLTCPDKISISCAETTKSIGAKGSGQITYSSSNTGIAAVSANGVITKKGTGSAVITVLIAGDANHNQAKAMVNVDVVYSHSIETVKGKAATHTEKGLTDGKVCRVCGYEEVKQQVIPVLANPFTDVPAGKYYTNDILYLLDKGIMSGLNKTTFGVGKNIVREDVVVIIHRMEGTPAAAKKASFKDVPAGKYYTDAVNWAWAEGIVTGYNKKTFGKGDNIIRQDFIKILYGYAKWKGYDTSAPAGKYKEKEDASQVSAYAVEAMNWGYANGFIGNGSPFRPKEEISRQDAATIIARFLRKYT
ncbi:MAG: leucine-rich repeat protein [Lachnospiraceae bacterium]|nr:leucine-rich repeat protein [Lachnospiraceae bacterium]